MMELNLLERVLEALERLESLQEIEQGIVHLLDLSVAALVFFEQHPPPRYLLVRYLHLILPEGLHEVPEDIGRHHEDEANDKNYSRTHYNIAIGLFV